MTPEQYVLNRNDWPYGPNVHVSMREPLVRWATERGVRLGRRYREVPRFVGCKMADKPFGLGNTWGGFSASYMDHVTYWLNVRGKPAIVLSQPYDVTPELVREAQEEADRLGLTLRVTDGWYGVEFGGTRALEFHITDRGETR